MKLKVQWLEKIYMNDPLILYYGFESDIVIKEQTVSEVLGGL